jgi:hypothetical protein
MTELFGFISSIIYFCGIVLTPGYWKLLSIFFPPYSLYVFCEKMLQHFGVI